MAILTSLLRCHELVQKTSQPAPAWSACRSHDVISYEQAGCVDDICRPCPCSSSVEQLCALHKLRIAGDAIAILISGCLNDRAAWPQSMVHTDTESNIVGQLSVRLSGTRANKGFWRGSDG